MPYSKKQIEDEAKAWAAFEFEDDRTLSSGVDYAFNGEGLHSLTAEELEQFLDYMALQYRKNMKQFLRKGKL